MLVAGGGESGTYVLVHPELVLVVERTQRSARAQRGGVFSDAEKASLLLEYISQHGSLDAPADRHEFDLRRRGAPILTPRVVSQPAS